MRHNISLQYAIILVKFARVSEELLTVKIKQIWNGVVIIIRTQLKSNILNFDMER